MPATHDVLIQINWVGHGRAHVMKRLVPDQVTLHAAATVYLRRNPGVFKGGLPTDHHALKLPPGSPGSLCLFPRIRSVLIAGESIDLRNCQGDSLLALMQETHDARAGLARFEIDVQSSSPGMQVGPPALNPRSL